jgi:hypothetical protein
LRKALVIATLLALAFAGYWFAVARGVEGGLRAWFAERAGQGWVAEYADLGTTGFPLRFETVLRDVALADPATGLAWTAPRFAIEAHAYPPNRIVAIWPATQTIASPYERIEIASERFEARVAFVPGTRLEVRELGADLGRLALSSTLGWEAGIAVGHLSATAIDGREYAYALRAEATGFAPPDALRRGLDPARLLPDVIEGLVAEANVTFDAPWDRFALENARPQPTAIALRSLTAQWGGIELRAAGDLTVDAERHPRGADHGQGHQLARSSGGGAQRRAPARAADTDHRARLQYPRGALGPARHARRAADLRQRQRLLRPAAAGPRSGAGDPVGGRVIRTGGQRMAADCRCVATRSALHPVRSVRPPSARRR